MNALKAFLMEFFKSFSKLPKNVPSRHYRYFVLTNYIYLLALFAHGSLLLSFWLIGVYPLALFNVGSCILFIILINTNLRGYLALSTALAAFEIIAHAVFCVYMLGWNSGFHYYILGLVVAFFIAPPKSRLLKASLAGIVAVVYVLLNYYSQSAVPQTTLEPVLQNIFNIGNLMIFIFVLSLAIYASDSAATKAEAELAQALVKVKISQEETEKKNEELAKKNRELVASHQRADRIFSALAEALPGTVLEGKYRLDKKIGAGGFGAVYRATHLAMQHPIAVKVFRPTPGNDSAEGLERFQLEAISASRVNHPNAVLIHDSGVSAEGIAYIAMELLEGHTLTDELREKGSLPIERCAEILMPVCDVLAQVHEAGIVHRDIKPDNIFLHQSPQGEIVKVVDFGIAKLLDASGAGSRNLTATGGFIGTATYMAPERFEGGNYDGRSDVYSVGIMLYEMLCGRVPFPPGGPAGQVGVMMHHMTKEPPSMRGINPNVPEAVEAVVMRSLIKDPEKRPTAGDLAQEFSAAVGIFCHREH